MNKITSLNVEKMFQRRLPLKEEKDSFNGYAEGDKVTPQTRVDLIAAPKPQPPFSNGQMTAADHRLSQGDAAIARGEEGVGEYRKPGVA